LTEGTELTGELKVAWRNRADWMFTGGTERNVDWRNRADWRVECWLEEESGLERGMLTGGTELTGERNVDWRNRVDWRGEC